MRIEQKLDGPGALACATGAELEADGFKAKSYCRWPRRATRNGDGWTPQQRWRERNPQADWAHNATRSALRRGLLRKCPCEVCGSTESEAHHVDYSLPLTVTWLCRRHHKAAHREARRGT